MSTLNRGYDCLTIEVSVCILFETMANGLTSIVLPIILDQAGGNLTYQIIISLEKSLPLSYQNRLEESENLLNEAAEKIAQTRRSVRPLLEMLSKCYLAAVYRRRKMLGKTIEFLDEANTITTEYVNPSKRLLSKKEAKTAKIQRLKAEVDMYYRIENLPKAEKRALEAIELVDSLEFYLERRPLQDRLEDIRRTIAASSKPSSSEKYRETPKPAGSSSEQLPSRNNSRHSSETENKEF